MTMQSGTYPRRAIVTDETNSTEYSIIPSPLLEATDWLWDPDTQAQPGYDGETLRALLAEYGIN